MIQGNNSWIDFLLDEYVRTPKSSGPVNIQSPPSRNVIDARENGDQAYHDYVATRMKDSLMNPHTKWSQHGRIDAEPPEGLGPPDIATQQNILLETMLNAAMRQRKR